MATTTGSRAGIKFATLKLVVPTSIFKKKSKKTKLELGGGIKLIIHKIKLCS